jgi:hypothetical protein
MTFCKNIQNPLLHPIIWPLLANVLTLQCEMFGCLTFRGGRERTTYKGRYSIASPIKFCSSVAYGIRRTSCTGICVTLALPSEGTCKKLATGYSGMLEGFTKML